ncbi:hypothetical protein [uncultured Maribacter sp.]|uniref:DUF6892 domain-containing protein n=1 Tax=uncultured Maribacter sp. TaxID=431308 RepID=UPI0026372507|nr:hypothetical protein [uncultured Maribacter sp.]
MKDIEIFCTDSSLKINGKELLFPVSYETLENLFGEPIFPEDSTFVVWNDLGISAFSHTCGEDYDEIYLHLSKYPSKFLPELTNSFQGELFINQKAFLNEIQMDYFESQEYAVFKLEETNYFFAVLISNLYKEKEIPKDKYVIEQPSENVLEFKDFGFKLSVIQELMYNKELLEPKFDLHEFVEWYGKRKIDIEKEGHEPIPEVTQYFKELPIPMKYASEITEIYQDGGNEIYMQLLRFGEGWEDY